MNNDSQIKLSQSNLEKVEVEIVNTINALTSQGYFVNNAK